VRPQSHLVRRGAVYYFRARVPSDLVEAVGKKEVKRSLQTSDFKEAKLRAKEVAVEVAGDFEAIRRQLPPKVNVEALRAPRRSITGEEFQFLLATMRAGSLRADEELRVEGLRGVPFSDPHGLGGATLQERREVLSQAIRSGDTEAIQPALDDWLMSYGFEINTESEQYRKLAYEFAKASAAALDAKLRREAGEVVDSPEFPAEAPSSLRMAVAGTEATLRPAPTLRTVMQRWIKERTPAQRTIDEYGRFLDLFDDVNGPSIPLARITKAHVVAFKDRLVDDGLQAATIQKRLAAIKTLLNFAETNDLVPSNVARTVNVVGSRVKKKARLPFREADLQRIFSSPVFASGERPVGGGGQAAYWLPVLGLYTGARQEELAQLAVADVREEEGGIIYLVVTDEGEGAKVKTASSRRSVPLHRDVLDLGFLDYVRAVKKTGATHLFPELRPDRYGRRAGNWSKWFGRYLRKDVGIEDRRLVFHSFRHTFKDICRNSNVSEEVHDALTGHTGGEGIGRQYGLGVGLRTLNDAVQRLTFGSVKVPARTAPR